MRNGLLIFLWLWVLGSLEAQRAFKPIQPKKGRLALVIGNSAYLGQALPNAANDAQDMAKTLSLLGFEVILKENLTKNQMEEEISAFVKQLSNYKVGLFYFAGHGFLSTQKDNYLMSTGVHRGMTETFAKSHSIALEDVMGSMDEVENTPTKILIVDACRNNPFRSWG
ncbi:caspase family protein [Runella sp. MFBS21]|nr:caspase family protein [Runella sp. MFBS21]MDF7821825.1 caspase family protein [Runella sp. MFBS21]